MLLERKFEVRLSTVVGFALAAALVAVLILMEAGVPSRRAGTGAGVPIDGLSAHDLPGYSGPPVEDVEGPVAEPPAGLDEPPEADDDRDGAPAETHPGALAPRSGRGGALSVRPLPIWGPGSSSPTGDSTARRGGGIGRLHDPDLRNVQPAPGESSLSDGAGQGDGSGAAAPVLKDPESDDAGAADPEPRSYHTIQARAQMAKQNADALVGHLRGLGFPEAFSAFHKRDDDGVPLYYVFVGKYLTKSEADERHTALLGAIRRQPYPGGRNFCLDSYTRKRTLP
jgi:hypothetical protein